MLDGGGKRAGVEEGRLLIVVVMVVLYKWWWRIRGWRWEGHMTKMLVEKGGTCSSSCIVMSRICGGIGNERGKNLS